MQTRPSLTRAAEAQESYLLVNVTIKSPLMEVFFEVKRKQIIIILEQIFL